MLLERIKDSIKIKVMKVVIALVLSQWWYWFVLIGTVEDAFTAKFLLAGTVCCALELWFLVELVLLVVLLIGWAFKQMNFMQ